MAKFKVNFDFRKGSETIVITAKDIEEAGKKVKEKSKMSLETIEMIETIFIEKWQNIADGWKTYRVASILPTISAEPSMLNVRTEEQVNPKRVEGIASVAIEYFNGYIHGKNNLTINIDQENIKISYLDDECNSFTIAEFPIIDLLKDNVQIKCV
jgi:hypothetical protein